MWNLVCLVITIVPVVAAVWSWLTEEAPTQEEMERASMRSYSWPSKPGQDAFSTGVAAALYRQK